MNKKLSRIFLLAQRNVKEILRDPLSFIFMLAMPLVMEILFYFIFHKLTSQFEMKYLAPGIAVFAQSFLALFAGILISTDRNTAFLTRLFVSKAKSDEFIAGYAFALLPISLIQSVLFFIVGGIIDPSLFGLHMLYSVLISVAISLFYISIGILIGCLCNEKAVGGVSSIVIAGQSILSGMWFPTEGLGGAMITIMKCLPFRNATLVVQNTLNGITDFKTDFLVPLLIVAGYTVAAFILAVCVFGAKMKEK